jgi:flagellar export protein FliJ
MPPFRFRLQTLERLREAARDACREQLADALRVDDRLREQETELQTQIALARSLQIVPAGGRVDVDRLLQAQRYEASVTLEVRHVQDQRKQLAAEIERRRAALVEADREVKSLEKLKEARLAEHRQQEQRQEMKLLDEVAGRPRGEEVDVWAS